MVRNAAERFFEIFNHKTCFCTLVLTGFWLGYPKDIITARGFRKIVLFSTGFLISTTLFHRDDCFSIGAQFLPFLGVFLTRDRGVIEGQQGAHFSLDFERLLETNWKLRELANFNKKDRVVAGEKLEIVHLEIPKTRVIVNIGWKYCQELINQGHNKFCAMEKMSK